MLITKIVRTSHLIIHFLTFESYKTFPKTYANKMWIIDMNNVSSFSLQASHMQIHDKKWSNK